MFPIEAFAVKKKDSESRKNMIIENRKYDSTNFESVG